jgi:uncharacterized protein (DUF433 family)
MAVTQGVYKIVKKAVQIRINRGESIEDAIAAYPALSEEQIKQLKSEVKA